jgi:hypothetical protein
VNLGLVQSLHQRTWSYEAVGVVQEVSELIKIQTEVQPGAHPSAMGHVRWQEENVWTLLNEMRPEVWYTRGPKLGKVDLMVTFHPHGDKAPLVAYEEGRGTVTWALINFG